MAAGSTPESTTAPGGPGVGDSTAEEAAPSKPGQSAGGGGGQSGGGQPAGGGASTAGGGGSTDGGSGAKGGGGSSGSASTASLIRQGEAICEQARKEQARGLSEFAGKQQSGVSQKAVIEELTLKVALPAVRTALEKLGGLDPPSDAAAEFDAIVSGLEAAVKEVEADPSASIDSPKNPFEEADRLAREFGLEVCARMA